MPLHGFLIPKWIGYLCGFLFIQKPWGHPTFKSWCSSPIIIWTLFLTVLQACVIHDVGMSYDDNNFAPKNESNNNPIFRYLHYSILAFTCLTVLAFRFYFCRAAKPLAKLLNRLSRYELLQKDEMYRNWRNTWILAQILITLFLFVATLSTVLFTITFTKAVTNSSGIRMLSWMGNFSYIVYAMVYFSGMTLRYVVFALIIVVTLNLGMIYNEICDAVEVRLLGNDMHKDNDPSISGHNHCELLNRFEKLKWLAEEAERILGAFVFILILGSGWMLVTGLYNVIAGTYTGGLSYITVGEQFIYISLIFSGQCAANIMKLRRKRLQRILTLKPTSRFTNGGRLAYLLLAFQWRLTACNIFDVDNKLLSGIVSNSMNYIVVLFQFQMAMQSNSKQIG